MFADSATSTLPVFFFFEKTLATGFSCNRCRKSACWGRSCQILPKYFSAYFLDVGEAATISCFVVGGNRLILQESHGALRLDLG